MVGVGYELDSAAKTGVVITEGMPEVKTMEGVYFFVNDKIRDRALGVSG